MEAETDSNKRIEEFDTLKNQLCTQTRLKLSKKNKHEICIFRIIKERIIIPIYMREYGDDCKGENDNGFRKEDESD
jgi:hypothetical protein